MSTNFPTSLDTFTTRANGGVIDASHVNDLQDSVAALQAKVGITSSAVTSSLDYKVSSSSSVDPGHKHSVNSISATGTPSATTFLRGDGVWTGSVKFGGTGADGALSITSGTTTINLGGAQFYVLNYTSISITGTGVLAFSNPHANGTTIIIKSQGDVTLTSSATPMIDCSGLGAAGGAGSTSTLNSGNDGIGFGVFRTNKGSGSGGAVPTSLSLSALNFNQSALSQKYANTFVGAGGGGGGGESTSALSGAGGDRKSVV